MSRWNDFGWHKPAPKKPPARAWHPDEEGGHDLVGPALDRGARRCSARRLRAARAGANLRARGSHARPPRQGGKGTAKVTGSRATPYKITVELTELGAPAWRKAIEGMATKAQFAAELLAGQMPQEIDEVFREGA